MNTNWYYLLINLGCIAIPLLLSFDKKVAFFKRWKAFWPANIITLAFFIIWDAFFTANGIWGFNDTYLIGPRILGMPFEEWLFFICVPYASVFLYDTFRAYIPGYPFKTWGKPTLLIVGALSLFLLFAYPLRLYTSFTAGFTFIAMIWLWIRKSSWMGWFAFAYLIVIIPFILANGLLTGLDFWQYPLFNTEVNAITDQIVWYNNDHNLRIRLFSIPFDDLLYGFLLLAMNTAIYEYLNQRYQFR